jgi:pimeloyl-ACP methyl ester carboxylesterase
MRSFGRAIRAAGYSAFMPRYDGWGSSLEAIVEQITSFLAERKAGQERPIHFVGHSMGGLVARAVVWRLRPRHMGRMVMLGTPNNGSELADFADLYDIFRPILGQAGPALKTGGLHPLLCDLPAPDYEVGVVAGNRPLFELLRILPRPHDGKVSVASTHLKGERDHIILPVTHALMPFDHKVQAQTARFLRSGTFSRDR